MYIRKFFSILMTAIFISLIAQINLFAPKYVYASPEISYTNFQSASFKAAAYGNSKYVAVGYKGATAVSSDALSWSYSTPNDSFNYSDVIFANNLFVAVGGNGVIKTSSDGITWTSQSSGTTAGLDKIVYTGTEFYIVGYSSDTSTSPTTDSGVVLKSSNGTTWTPVDIGGSNKAINSIAYGNSTIAITDYSGNVYYSNNNGSSWSKTTINNSINFITFLHDRFYIGTTSAYLYYSTNAASWTNVGDPFRSVATGGCSQPFCGLYDGSKYYMFGFDISSSSYGGVMTSTDGTSFTSQHNYQNSTMGTTGCLYAKGKYIQCGGQGIRVSTDGTNWRYATATGKFNSVVFDGSNYVAVGDASISTGATTFSTNSDGTIYKSSDFSNWTMCEIPLIKTLKSIAYGKGKYVAVGSANNGNNGEIVESSNSTDWSVSSSPNVEGSLGLTSVVYANNLFVAVGGKGSIITSSDGGQTWTSAHYCPTTPTYTLNFVDYINGQFVACGYNGSVLYSTDGTSWTESSTGITTETFNGVAYGNGKYVLVGIQSGKAMSVTSSDLSPSSYSAAQTDSDSSYLNFYRGVKYQDGSFVAFGNLPPSNAANPNEAYLSVSSDGTNWTKYDGGFAKPIYGINYLNNKFRVVGYDGLALSAKFGTSTAPTATTGLASSITSTGATLNGTVNANNADAAVTFEYGTTPSYGNTATAAESPVTGSSATSVIAAVSGLSPNTTYYYRVTATNTEGTTSGTQGSFTTLAGDSSINPSTTSFDKNTANQADVAVTMSLNGNTLSSITNTAGTSLISGTDYTVGGNTVTIKKSYLAALSTGTAALTFTFSGGSSQSLAITVSDTTMYTVTFKDYNGTTIGTPQSVNYGGSATAPANLTREGYIFTGWDKTFNNVSGDLVVTAEYSINQYTLTYAAGANGSISGAANQTVNWGTDGTEVTAVPAVGYHFASWSDLVTNATRKDSNVIASKSVTAQFAINSYNVNYDSQGGNAVTGTTANYGEKVTAPTASTRTGYTFGGWYKEAACQNPWNFATDTVTADTTMYAKWAINSYTVIFKDYNGTTIGTPQSINYGENAAAPANPTREGYNFTGWDKTFNNVSGDLVVTAEYSNSQYTLTYAAGANGTITGSASQTVNWGADGTEVTAVPAIGYHFASWSDLVTNATRKDTNVIASKSVTAQFAINSYNVNYDSQGGNAVTGTTANYGEKAGEPTAPTKTGYTFEGWYKEAACQNPWNFAADTVTADTTMYAKWAINSYTVTFKDYNGTTIGTPQSVNYGGNAATPTDPTRAGYIFTGWDKTFNNVTGDLVVTAEYSNSQYTLTYAAGANGSIKGTANQTVNWGAAGTEVTAVPATGYHFTSWSDLVTNATRKDTNVIASESLTAQFAINNYNVNYDSQGGNAVTGTTVNYGEKVTVPTAPTKTDYTFGGWYKEAACQNPWNFAADTVTADTTMYAKWTINSYTVTFEDYNDTIIGTSQSVTYGSNAVAPVDPTRTGYVFAGWDKEFKNITGDLVVKAKYTSGNTYTFPSTTTSDNIAEVKTPIGYVQSGDNTLVINNNNAKLSIPASVIDMTGVSGSDYIKITEKVVNNTTTGTMALFTNLPNSVQMVGSPLSLNIQLFDANDNLIKDIHQFANNQKVKVTIKLTSDQIKSLDTSKLSMYYYDETKKEWDELGGSFDTNTIEFTFYTPHFTNFAIMQKVSASSTVANTVPNSTVNSISKEKPLPKTGSIINFNVVLGIGTILIVLGALMLRKRKVN